MDDGKKGMSGMEGDGDEWDAGQRKFFLLMFRFQKAGSSKFSAFRLWLRTDRRLMPWLYWLL